MNYVSLNIDEIIYQIHLFLWTWLLGPLWYIISFQWLFDFLGIFGLFNNRPSIERDTINEALNPRDQKDLFDVIRDIFFGTGDHQSILGVLFGSIFGLMVIAAIVAFLISLYYKDKMKFISEKEKIMYDLVYTKQEKEIANDKAVRWQKILDQVNSDNPNNWKVAILEADVLLNDVLGEQGFFGETVSDKLKDAQTSNIESIQFAWDAHKIRNNIAHQIDYNITQHEARMAISMYERFFNEFYHAS